MTTEKFPIFSLPHLALKKVLEKTDIISIVILATCSKNAKKRIRECNLEVKDMEFVFNDTPEQLRVRFGRFLTYWQLLDTTHFRIVKRDDRDGVLFYNQYEGLESVRNFMQDLFVSIKHFGVYIEDSLYSLSGYMTDELRILKPKIVRFNRPSLTSEELIEFECKIPHVDTLIFEQPVPETDARFNARILRIPDARLLYQESYLTPHSERIVIGEVNIPSFDIYLFIEGWKNGRYPRLELLIVRHFYVDYSLNIPQEFWVENQKTSDGTRLFYDDGITYDYSEGMIFQNTDGKTATVQFSPNSESVYMFVWPS